MKRIALGVQYDGSPFCGYQKQPNKNTVQDHLELALAKFTKVSLPTTCAGRTDTGVHALEQVVHFDTDLQRDLNSWVRGVNAFLPDAIAVRWAHELPERPGEDFHARFGARSRTYHYVLFNHPVRSPLVVGRAGWVFQPLDVAAMHEAAQALVGTHDFTTFRAAGCQAKTAVKNMYEMRVERRGAAIVFTLRASAFLHHMVRNIVGSLIYIGQGRQPVGWMRELVDGANRHVAAPTFMPDGLYLAKIDYDAEWALPHDAVSPLPWF